MALSRFPSVQCTAQSSLLSRHLALCSEAHTALLPAPVRRLGVVGRKSTGRTAAQVDCSEPHGDAPHGAIRGEQGRMAERERWRGHGWRDGRQGHDHVTGEMRERG